MTTRLYHAGLASLLAVCCAAQSFGDDRKGAASPERSRQAGGRQRVGEVDAEQTQKQRLAVSLEKLARSAAKTRSGFANLRTQLEPLMDYGKRKVDSAPQPQEQADLTKGRKLLERGLAVKALREVSNVIDLEVPDPNAFALRARILIGLGFPDSAMADTRAGLKLAKRDANLLCLEAAALLDLGFNIRATMSATEALQADPFLIEAYHVRGLAYQSRGKDSLAKRDLAWAKMLAEKAVKNSRPEEFASDD